MSRKIKAGISIHGLFYFLFSFGTLIIGLLRGEFFSSVVGLILSTYYLYVSISVLITLMFWKKEDLLVTIDNNEFIILKNKKDSNFPTIMFGCNVQYVFHFECVTSSINIEKKYDDCIVSLNSNAISGIFYPKSRGEYNCISRYLLISDLSKFYKFIIPQNTAEHIPTYYVLPNIIHSSIFKLPYLFSEKEKIQKTIFRDDELYDSRLYYPGDDIRKINWKVYSHTNNLTIRQGDFLPPPEKNISIFVDSPFVVLDKYKEYHIAQYDLFINKICGIIDILHKEKYNIRISIFYNSKVVSEIINSDIDDEIAKSIVMKFLSKPQIIFVKDKSDYVDLYNDFNNIQNTLSFPLNVFFLYTGNFSLRDTTCYKNHIVYIGPDTTKIVNQNFLYKILFETKVNYLKKLFIEEYLIALSKKIQNFKKDNIHAEKF